MEDLSLAIAGGSDPYLCCERAVQAALGRLGRLGKTENSLKNWSSLAGAPGMPFITGFPMRA